MAANRRTAREFFATELKYAREAKGMTQEALGKAVHKAASTVAMWETARRLPQVEDMPLIEKVLGTNGYLTRLHDRISDEAPIEWFGKWLHIERNALSLHWFELVVIPGLLQTEAYARALLRFSTRSSADIEEQVRARIDRQSILTDDNPPMFVAIIDEAALHRAIGGPEAMYAQLMHLVEMTRRPDTIIQVVPFGKGEYAGLQSSFVIAGMNGRKYVYLDNALRADVLEQVDDVAAIERLWDNIRGDALSAEASIELIEKVAKKWS